MPPDLERIRRICANAAAARALADAGVPEPEPDEDATVRMAIRAVIEVYAIENPPAPLDRLSPEDRRRFRPTS